MSLFQSGPYQSKVLRSVVQKTRHWVEQSQIALRQLRTTISWSAQVLLYPVYATFQVVRLAGAQLRRVLEFPVPQLRTYGKNEPAIAQKPDPLNEPLTADTPIRQALQMVHSFSLLAALPGLIPAIAPSAFSQPSEQSQQPSGCIQGIASCLETRSLVLVTNSQEVMDILTPEQQKRLQQRITSVVHRYSRSLETQTPKAAAVPELSTSQPGFSVIQVFKQLITFVQSVPVGEPLHEIETRLRPILTWVTDRLQGMQQHPFPPLLKPAIAPPTVDNPVQEALQTIQGFSFSSWLLVQLSQAFSQAQGVPGLPEQSSGLALHASPDLIVLAPNASDLDATITGCLAHLTTVLSVTDELSMSEAGTSLKRPLILIHGIATRLETRSLVLVTQHNQILDILTPEQQDQLRRRMIWSIAIFWRYRRMQQSTHRILARLRPPGQNSKVLPPVRLFWQLMAWVQSGPVAIAANLFQEAALPPTIGFPSRTISSLPESPSRAILTLPQSNPQPQAWALVHRTTQTARAMLSDLSTALIFPPVSPATISASVDAFVTADAFVTESFHPRPSIPPSTGSISTTTAVRSPQHSPDYLEIPATLIGYIQSPLEKLLRLLDRCFSWLENVLAAIWRKIQSYL